MSEIIWDWAANKFVRLEDDDYLTPEYIANLFNANQAEIQRLRDRVKQIDKAAFKFVEKCESGRARSTETYSELCAYFDKYGRPNNHPHSKEGV